MYCFRLQGSTGELHLCELFVRVVAIFELYELRSGRQLLFALHTVVHRKPAPYSNRINSSGSAADSCAKIVIALKRERCGVTVR